MAAWAAGGGQGRWALEGWGGAWWLLPPCMQPTSSSQSLGIRPQGPKAPRPRARATPAKLQVSPMLAPCHLIPCWGSP